MSYGERWTNAFCPPPIFVLNFIYEYGEQHEVSTEETKMGRGRKRLVLLGKDIGKEGGRTIQRSWLARLIQLDDGSHPIGRLGSSVWMSLVNRLEKSVLSPAYLMSCSLG